MNQKTPLVPFLSQLDSFVKTSFKPSPYQLCADFKCGQLQPLDLEDYFSIKEALYFGVCK